MVGGAQLAGGGQQRQGAGCGQKSSAIHEISPCIVAIERAAALRVLNADSNSIIFSEFFTVPGEFVSYWDRL
jgi:hypothetical protein